MPEAEEKESGDRAEKEIRPRRVSEEEQARREGVKVRFFFSHQIKCTISTLLLFLLQAVPKEDRPHSIAVFFSSHTNFQHCWLELRRVLGRGFCGAGQVWGRSAARKTRR